MLKQIAISLALVAVTVLGWAFFVPGANDMLAGYGIRLPTQAVTESASAQQPGAPASVGGQQAGARPQGGGFGRGGFGGNRNAVVVTQPVVMATINDSLTAIGEGTAAQSVTVTTPAGGTLVRLLVQPGETVTAGQVIGQLDAQAEQIAFDKAQLAAKAATETLERSTGLAASNSISTAQLNAAKLAADTATLELRNAELALQRRTIASPLAGTVGLMQVTAGNYVSANTPVTTVDDTSEIIVAFFVPERYASAIAVGMPVEASAVALPGQVFAGTVSATDNRIDSASRTLQVQARIPNADRTIRAGMSFAVTMRFAGDSFPSVNPLAIQWSADGSYVWRYADGKAAKVMARIIQRNSDGVLVEGDLAAGDPIITEGVLQLSEGASVTLLGAPAEPGANRPRPAAPQS